MTTPQTKIQERIRARIKEIDSSAEIVAQDVNNSDLYGEFNYGTLRNLLTWDYESDRKPRTTFNRQLLVAISWSLNCLVTDIATEEELQSLRDVPYRRAQWPAFMLEEQKESNPKSTVAAPRRVMLRVTAYARQHAYNSAAEFAEALRRVGYSISDRNMQRIMSPGTESKYLQRHVTFEFCEAVARVFRGRLNKDHFEVEWILKCQDRCPHCRPFLITA